eukprot:scaffold15034_cov56-Phaeocystis_antarctica.AAC.1
MAVRLPPVTVGGLGALLQRRCCWCRRALPRRHRARTTCKSANCFGHCPFAHPVCPPRLPGRGTSPRSPRLV